MKFTERLDQYAQIMAAYEARGVSEALDPNDKENLGAGGVAPCHYFSVGSEALEIIVSQLVLLDRQPPQTILDFPSGSGRVTRHLRAAFPDARIGACDLYHEHVDFCVDQFGAERIYSTESLADLELRPEWDVIFVGSLLTHLPRSIAKTAFLKIAGALSDTGIAIITLEGRRSIEIQKHFYEIIPPKQFRKIEAQYRITGFGFNNYQSDFRGVFNKNKSYGSAFVRPDWVVRQVMALPGVRLLGYTERAWDNHQDYVVFGKPAAVGLGH